MTGKTRIGGDMPAWAGRAGVWMLAAATAISFGGSATSVVGRPSSQIGQPIPGVPEADAVACVNLGLTLPGVIDFETIGWSPSSGPRQVRYTVTGTLWYQTPSEIAQLLFDTGMRRPKVTFGKDGQMTLTAAD